MKKHVCKVLFLICVVLMAVCAVSAWAFAEEATPTDLCPNDSEAVVEAVPEEKTEETEKPAKPEETEEADGAAETVEIIITKSLRIGQGWEGRIKRTKPVVLKLDVDATQPVYMVVEGKNVCAAIANADQPEEPFRRSTTDPETRLSIVRWDARTGSYLITVSPDENSLMVQAKVTFLDEKAFTAWEEARVEALNEKASEPEDAPGTPAEKIKEDPAGSEPATEEQDAEEEEEEEPELALPENRSIYIDMTWDTDHPRYGDTAHFDSVITGYDNVTYTLQWQISRDEKNWTNYAGATAPQLDVVLTEELNGAYFRLVIYVESEQEKA